MSKTEHTGGRVLLALGVLLAALFILSFRLGRYGVDSQAPPAGFCSSRLLPWSDVDGQRSTPPS